MTDSGKSTRRAPHLEVFRGEGTSRRANYGRLTHRATSASRGGSRTARVALGQLPLGPDRQGSGDAAFRDRENICQHYREIGHLLQVCEVNSTRIGIPWLPPTARVTALRTELNQPLNDFIRCGLVHIPTPVLESYCEDLGADSAPRADLNKSSPNSDDEVTLTSNRALGIGELPGAERYSLLAVSGVLAVMIGAVQLLFAAVLPFTSHAISLMFFGVACAIVTVLTSDTYRRASFSWVISDEIMRRRGIDTGSETHLRLYSVEPNPLSK